MVASLKLVDDFELGNLVRTVGPKVEGVFFAVFPFEVFALDVSLEFGIDFLSFRSEEYVCEVREEIVD